jgi:mannose-1-phosphate guanylyltransferase
MSMKAFLLSAGEGTRLRPLTNHLPKCLVPIGKTPMLAIWLDICRQIGITDVLINLQWKPEPVREFIRDYQTPLRISLTHEEELLGSAGTVRNNWEWVHDQDRFWVIYTDVLIATDLRKLVDFDRGKEGTLTMGLHRVKDPRGCGLATVNDEGRVLGFEEKAEHPLGNLAFAGILLARPSLIKYLPEQASLDFGRDVFPRLTGKMWGYIIPDYVLDVGTHERLAEAQWTWPGYPSTNPP